MMMMSSRSCSPFALAAFAVAMMITMAATLISAQSFQQSICVDPSCTMQCQTSSLQQGVCYTTNVGGTATGMCQSASRFLQTTYAFTNDCSGLSDTQHLYCGTCYASGNQYIMFLCPHTEGSNNNNNSNNTSPLRGLKSAGAAVQHPPLLSGGVRQYAALSEKHRK